MKNKNFVQALIDDFRDIDYRSITAWGILIYFLFAITVQIMKSPDLFIFGLFVLYIIRSLRSQIDELEKKLETKEKEWNAVDFESRFKALKSLEKDE